MPDSVKEIWVAKGDVLRARSYLLPDVIQNHIVLDHTKHPLIDRDNRAVAARMLATSAGLRVAYDPTLIVSHI